MSIKKITKNLNPVYGDEGAAVKKYQKMLAKTGSKIQINGRFTIGMTTAIKSFQKKAKIKVTGKLDAKTVNAMDSWGKKPAAKTEVKAVKTPAGKA